MHIYISWMQYTVPGRFKKKRNLQYIYIYIYIYIFSNLLRIFKKFGNYNLLELK